MKTTNNAQKTENKKFENSVSKTFAVILSLILISFTVSANGFWKHILMNNAYGKMAIMMLDQKSEELKAYSNSSMETNSSEAITSASTFYFEVAQDKNLEIENWMMNKTNFKTSLFAEKTGADKLLKIEDWMIENPYFKVPEILTDSETALKIEPWMTDNSIWFN